MNMRRKTIRCGKERKPKYIEVDIYPYTAERSSNRRNGRTYISSPKQKKLNDKNARRYFGQLIKGNFSSGDLHVVPTYKNAPSEEEAEKQIRNFIRRIKSKNKKKGYEEIKYISVLEKTKTGRIHHHLILKTGLTRDEVEDLWRYPRKKGEKKGEKIGHINADALDEENGFEDIINYLAKDPNGRKRWNQSQNLEKPWFTIRDNAISRRTVEKIAALPEDCEDIKKMFEKSYKGYILDSLFKQWNEEVGNWYFYIKLHRKE